MKAFADDDFLSKRAYHRKGSGRTHFLFGLLLAEADRDAHGAGRCLSDQDRLSPARQSETR